MPKSTKKENSKEKKTTKTTVKKAQPKTTKKAVAAPKKTNVKKVEVKKVEKKAPVKKVEVKKVEEKAPVKKVEVKKVEEKVETKKVEEKVVVKEDKGFFDKLLDEAMSNKPFSICLCISIILAAILIFVACTKKVPKTSDGKDIVASVKGKTITADDLYLELKEEGGMDALVNIIDKYITDKEVKVTDDDKAYVDEVVEYYKNYADYYGTDLATFLANYVGLRGITTEDEFYDYVLDDYKKSLAVMKFVGDTAKEDDLKSYYEENYSDKLTVKHILIEVNSDTTDAEAKKKAQSLIDTLNATDAKNLDAKFNELAQNNSDDTTTYSNGGLLEGITVKDVASDFFDAASKLKDGEYTKEPVKTSYGYHVILKVSSTPREKYADIKETVKKEYAQYLLSMDSTLYTKKWAELRDQYKLSIEDDKIKEEYINAVKESTKEEEN